VDASDPRRDEHIAAVNSVLTEIGANEIPQILIYNKIDRLELQPRLDRDADGRAAAVWISAERANGLDLLADAVAERLTRFVRRARIRVPASAGAIRSRLYAAKAVRAEQSADDGSIELAVELPDVELLTLARTPGVHILEVQGENMPCASGTAYLQSTAVSGGHAS
jgi:GTP-binding protein HflX